MHTNFKVYNTIQELEEHWKYTVMVEVDLPITVITKRIIHEWMCTNYGRPSRNWSLRWTLLGVDIKFHKPKDYFKFCMFQSKCK